MTTLHLTRGLPASGKTTWARALVASRVPGQIIRLNRDDLRRSLIDPGYRRPEHVVEQRITAVQHQAARDALRAGVDVVVDDTNLRAKYARAWADLVAESGADLEVHDFAADVDECVRRDAQRTGPEHVGERVIRDMHARFLSSLKGGRMPPVEPSTAGPVGAMPYTPRPGAPLAVMVDIDGTVALHGDRDPYDATRYAEDQPNQAVITAVRAMHDAGHEVLFCSGRDEDYRDVTTLWLTRHVPVRAAGLFMRGSGDRRNDAVVKLELFDRHIRDQYAVTCVFDDRDRVVKGWRSIGLTVMQVADGNF